MKSSDLCQFKLPFFIILLTFSNLPSLRCKSYEKAKKKLMVLEAPNVLTIVLKRFQVILCNQV